MVAPGPFSRSGQQQARLAAVAAILVLLALWRAFRRPEAAEAAVVPRGPAMACPRELDQWRRMHAKLVAEVAKADAGRVRRQACMVGKGPQTSPRQAHGQSPHPTPPNTFL